VADWDVKARKAKLTYTISLYGVTSEASKVVVYNPAQFEYSE